MKFFEKKLLEYKQNIVLKSDLRDKLKSENTFKIELRSLFARMLGEYRINYANTGRIIDSENYNSDWVSTLKKHYSRVQKQFLSKVMTQNNIPDDVIDKDELISNLGLTFLNWRNINAPKQADLITQTNREQMNDATLRATRDLRLQDSPLDNASIAALGATYLRRLTKPRVDTIALFATQTAAERAKNYEADELSRAVERVTPIENRKPDTKSWLSKRDKRVRVTHMDVDRRTTRKPIPINETFRVGNSLLMYPTDTSLGAELKEIMRCRCSAYYNIFSA